MGHSLLYLCSQARIFFQRTVGILSFTNPFSGSITGCAQVFFPVMAVAREFRILLPVSLFHDVLPSCSVCGFMWVCGFDNHNPSSTFSPSQPLSEYSLFIFILCLSVAFEFTLYPLMGSGAFLLGYPRPFRFWERNYQTSKLGQSQDEGADDALLACFCSSLHGTGTEQRVSMQCDSMKGSRVQSRLWSGIPFPTRTQLCTSTCWDRFAVRWAPLSRKERCISLARRPRFCVGFLRG